MPVRGRQHLVALPELLQALGGMRNRLLAGCHDCERTVVGKGQQNSHPARCDPRKPTMRETMMQSKDIYRNATLAV